MSEWNKDAADKAAIAAEQELDDLNSFEDVCMWQYKYYLACGHKALGRLLVSHVKETDLINEAEQLTQRDFE